MVVAAVVNLSFQFLELDSHRNCFVSGNHLPSITHANILPYSIRFRSGIKAQGLEHLLPFKNWTYPYGPIFSVVLSSFLVLVQGWSCFSPEFQVVDFVSFYIELPIMLIMFVGWKLLKKTKWVKPEEMDLVTDRFDQGMTTEEREEALGAAKLSSWSSEKTVLGKAKCIAQWLFA